MSHYHPYPAYKDSGVEPVGAVPEHWDVARVARLGPLQKANGGSKEDNVESGVPCIRYGDLYTTHDHWIRHTPTFVAEEKAAEYTPIQHGDVLFAASGETFEEIGKSAVNLLPDGACCGGDVIGLRPSPAADPLFLGYALDCSVARVQKAQMGKGFTVKHIYADQLRNLLLALPPVTEQRAIAAALDQETARIDALIAKKTEFIGLLAKKRQALIAHAVTKGLDPKAKMRDSGVEWIGEVSAHWTVAPIKRWFSTTSGATPDTAQQAKYYAPTDGIPWIRTTDLTNGPIANFEIGITEQALSDTACKLIPKNAVLIAMYGGDGTIGKNGLLEIRACINQAICALLPSRHFVPEFTFAYVQFYRPHWMISAASTRKDPNISQEIIRSAAIVRPPEYEQQQIVAFLKNALRRIDVLAAKTQQSIDLLKQRRSALITAAVTGQIDIRNPT